LLASKLKPVFHLSAILLLLAGCVTVPTVEERRQSVDEIARHSGWHAAILPTTPYPLQAFMPTPIKPGDTLSIYIEGDGLAWRSRRRISKNPTPINPMALRLAIQDPHAAAYLARPCQYVSDRTGCNPSLWTSARFSSNVVVAMNQAIDSLKKQFSAKLVRLIGYSGGGGVAALVAARRDDVSQLITVAGNLDHVAWTRHHKISPLFQSLNPADAWQQLKNIPQVHFVGENDRIIGRFVAESYADRFPSAHRPSIKTVKKTDHHCCWPEKWPALLRSAQAD